MSYIDIHTHQTACESNTVQVFNIRLNSSVEAGWLKKPHSMGVHPWDIKSENDIHLINETSGGENLYMIGECGFDKNIDVPYLLQEKIFISQAEKANILQKPVIIHCVGYFNQLRSLYRQLQHRQQWIVHGFTGHPQLALQLIGDGFMLSFGKAIMQTGGKTIDAFRKIPSGTFFLETDECEYSIREIYLRAAQLRCCNKQILEHEILRNFKNLYGNGMAEPYQTAFGQSEY